MKKLILSFDVMVEPDLQRFARLALEAVEALGGSEFTASLKLSSQIVVMRDECMSGLNSIRAALILDDTRLLTECGGKTMLLAELPAKPKAIDAEAVSKALRAASESADPELLVSRNKRAEEEMARLEEMLHKKKKELEKSIQLAETDSLTGLLNRGAFDRKLKDAMSMNARQGYPLCLSFIDIDFFKLVNDTHGHQYGDRYLIRVAEGLNGAIRHDADYVCRVGGDEFAIIINAGEDIAERVSEKALDFMDSKLSIGISSMMKDDTRDSFVGRADSALYKAKELGRGRVVVYGRDVNNGDGA